VTRASPKIADYPFTTLSPNLGVAALAGGERTLTLADIPGLIEGAHAGVGLGHEFLRHIARTKVLLHLIDGAVADPVAAYRAVNAELALFDAELARKPQVVAINKLDLTDVRERLPEIRARFAALGIEPLALSAATGEGVPAVLARVAAVLDELAASAPPPVSVTPAEEEPVVLRPQGRAAERFTVEREPGGFRVLGRRVERLVAMTDLESSDSLALLQRQLKKLGVTAALEQAGVKPGDVVRFGSVELEWAS
jgi:GTP-binding protein